MTRRTRFPGRLLVPVLAVGLAGTVSSCSPVQTGAAAIVDDERITVSRLQDATEEVVDERGSSGQGDVGSGDLQRSLLSRMIYSMVFDEAAVRLGVTVTEAEVDAAVKSTEQQYGGTEQLEKAAAEAGIPSSMLRQAIRDNVTYEKVSEKLVPTAETEQQLQERESKTNDYLLEVADDMGISINPRYGTWDSETAVIQPAEARLSEPESGQGKS